jgi:hypothetical protein
MTSLSAFLIRVEGMSQPPYEIFSGQRILTIAYQEVLRECHQQGEAGIDSHEVEVCAFRCQLPLDETALLGPY